MALTKTVTYQPFQQTAIGFDADEIASAYSTEFPNATDIVEVVIRHTSGNFDETGHISTEKVGTAVPFISKVTFAGFEEWIVKGERDDVDAVLAKLIFFPADEPASRPYDAIENPTGWRNDLESYEWKVNATHGVYNDDPPGIGDTIFSVSVYDGSGTFIASETLTCSPVEPTTDNQRPYFSEEFDGVLGGLSEVGVGTTIDWGTIAHGTDEEHITLSVETYVWNVDTPLNNVLEPTGYDHAFVSDKLPEDNLASNEVFKITGELAEVQSFADNIKLLRHSSMTLKTRVKIYDGVVGSYLDKVAWFPQDLVPAGIPPNYPVSVINTPEDETVILAQNPGLDFDLTNMPEVDEFSVTMTFDTDAQAAILDAWENSDKLASIDTSVGITWASNTAFANAIAGSEAVVLDLVPDYYGTFTYTVEYKAWNTSVGSEYTYVNTVTVNVVDQPETSWTDPGIIAWNKNETVTVDTGVRVIDNALSGTGLYDVKIIATTFDDMSTDSVIPANQGASHSGFYLRHENTDIPWTWTDRGDGWYQLEFSGTRTQVNDALQQITMVPPVDWLEPAGKDPAYTNGFWLSIEIDRTTYPAKTLAFGDPPEVVFATATDTPDWFFSGSDPYPIDWEKNMSAYWDSGVSIADIAYEGNWHGVGPTDYLVKIRPMYEDNVGDIKVFNEVRVGTTSTQVSQNLDIGTGELTILGTKAEINEALENLCMLPEIGFTQPADAGEAHFFFDIEISRTLDGNVILPYPDTPANQINWGTDADAFVLSDNTIFVSMTPQDTFYNQNSVAVGDPNFQLRQTVDPKQPLVYYLIFTLDSTDILPYSNGVQIGSGNQDYADADYVDVDYIENNLWRFDLTHPNPDTLNQMLQDVYFEGNITGANVTMEYWIFRNGVLVQDGSTVIEELISEDNFDIETRNFSYPLSDPQGLRGEFEDYQMFVDTSLAPGTSRFDTMVVNYQDTINQPGSNLYVYNPEGVRIEKTSWSSSLEAVTLDETAEDNSGGSFYVNRYLTTDSVHDTVEKRFVFEPETVPVGGSDVSRNMYDDMLGYWEETKFRIAYDFVTGTDPVYTITKKQFVTKVTDIFLSVYSGRDEIQFIPNLTTGKSTCIRLPLSTAPNYTQVIFDAPNNNQSESVNEPEGDFLTATNHGPEPIWNMTGTTAPMGLVSRKSDMGILVCCHDSPDFLNTAPSPYNSQFGNSPAQDTFITVSGQPLKTNPTANGWQSASLSNTTSIVIGISGSGSDWKNNPQSIGDVLVDDDAGYVYFTACSSGGSGVMIVRQAITAADSVDTSSNNMRKISLTTAADIPMDTRKQITANSFKLGKLSDGTIVSCMGDIFNSNFKMTHYDPVTGNVTHSETISRVNWATLGSANFNTFFPVPGAGGSQWEIDTPLVQLNLDGYAMLGPYLYRWNGTNWEEAYAESGVQNWSQMINNSSLGDGVFIIAGNEFKRIGHPLGNPTTIYGTGVVPTESIQDRYTGHRRSKAFVSREYIYRFAT